MSVGDLAMGRELVVCVGTGGVGKTTIAAAIALGAAIRGRRVAVLTIDPAHQLARSLGLDALAPGGEPVPAGVLRAAGVELTGSLDAGMLDARRAWDDLVTRLIASDSARRRVLDNPFYQQLSSSFPGSNEYMAIEEVCRLTESGHYDLVVLDTPPAAHALEFFRAPERLDRLFERDVFDWLARPYEAVGRGAWRSVRAVVRLVVRRLERAAGQSTLKNVSSFIVALRDHLDALTERSRQARRLLYGAGAAFILIARPQQLALGETEPLARALRSLRSPLSAVIANRVHSAPPAGAPVVELVERISDPAAAAWLRWAWDDALGEVVHEQRVLDRLAGLLPCNVPVARVAEADRDVHSIEQLVGIADGLWQ